MDRARAIVSRCTGPFGQEDAAALSSTLVEAVEPAYSTVQSGNDRATHLRGALLRVRPILDVSAESLQRRLECHQVRVTLGSGRELPDDPYVLRGAWLDIAVDSVGDGLVVAVRVDDFHEAQRVLDRARRFGASRR